MTAIRALIIGIAMLPIPAVAQTQAQMNMTAAAEFGQADTAMTRQWTATYAGMKRRDAADRSRGGGFGYAAATLASQRAWLKFRDAQCVVEGGEFAGGSLQGMAAVRCKTRLTGERTAQLRMLEWKR